MMKYRNKKNGAVIEISSVLTGNDWEAVNEQPPVNKQEKAASTGMAKTAKTVKSNTAKTTKTGTARTGKTGAAKTKGRTGK